MLIRKQAKQSEIAAHYVKAVGEVDHTFLEQNDSVGIVAFPQNGKSLSGRQNATFHNGVGFDNGNGLCVCLQRWRSKSKSLRWHGWRSSAVRIV
ncbi:hypothetical protein OIU78_016306 [Salix suchowensis]|uniref:AMINO-ACID ACETYLTRANSFERASE n=1 Tax=Salix koriyanagi TaxID=2511006 RepID=A0A9Q0Z5I0_9ROSI|nr:hypothetical protein OIU78_016306 [Salix suchowensis]KAJ6722234.1 AMINO-ACID ACETYLTRANSFERASE [Salix koriyanagi]